MSPVTSFADIERLPPIEVSGSHKDVKAPRFGNQKFYWLYGVWLARGGINDGRVFLSVFKNDPGTINSIRDIVYSQFNLKVTLVDHSKNKYRVYLNSRAVGKWWSELNIEPQSECAWGIIRAASWEKSNDLVVTCKRAKEPILRSHLDAITDSCESRAREGKDSVDIYLKGFLKGD